MKISTGEKIQDLRKKKKMTQEQLADTLNVSRQSVSKWELDNAYPETDKLINIAEIFDVSVDYLLKDTFENKEQSKDNNRILTFNMIAVITVSMIVFGYVLGVLLSYVIERSFAPLIGFMSFFIIAFGAFIIYVIFRNKFLVTSHSSTNDKNTVFKNTKFIYYFLITAFFTLLPITFKVSVTLPLINEAVLVTMPFTIYLYLAVMFFLFGYLICECVESVHYRIIYNQKYEMSLYLLISEVVVILILITLTIFFTIYSSIRFTSIRIVILALIGLVYFTIWLPIYLLNKQLVSKSTVFMLIILFPFMIMAYIINVNYDVFLAITVPLTVLAYTIAIIMKPLITAIKAKTGNVILYYKTILVFVTIVTFIEVFFGAVSNDTAMVLIIGTVVYGLVNILIYHCYRRLDYSK